MSLFDASNLPYWLLLGMGILLFVLVIVSGGGDDDLDLDADADVDADISGTNPLDLDTDASDFGLTQALAWLGIGKAPLILLLATDLSLWGMIGWLLNVFVVGAIGSVLGGLAGGAVLLGSMMVALTVGGQIGKPIGKIFASFGEDTSSDRLIGCYGTVSTAQIPVAGKGRIGQVDVLDPARNLITINAVLPEWATIIPQRGSKVLVIERAGTSYFVIVKDSPDQSHWFSNLSASKDSR